MIEQIVVHHVDGTEIKGINRDGKEMHLRLEEPWAQFAPFLEQFDTIGVTHTNGVVRSNDFLIIEPHFLVSVTNVIDAVSCPRKVYVRTLGAEKLSDTFVLRRIVQGNLLHDVFSHKLAGGLPIDKAIDIVLNNSKLDLLASDMDMEEARNYLVKDAGAMAGIQAEGLTEIDCQNWVFGLHGKFDGMIQKQIIELKSSRIPSGTPWPSHNIQMNIYLQMMEERGTYVGNVLYISDGEMGIFSPTQWGREQTLVGRNLAYLVQTGRLVPHVLRGDKAKECRNCYVKEGCWKLCAGLETQRDCDNCTQNGICDQNAWSKTYLDYYNHFVNALLLEEKEGHVETFLYSRAGTRDENFRESLVQNGFAIMAEKKTNETLGDSGYLTTYKQRSVMPRFRKGDLARVYDLNDLHDQVTMYFSVEIVDIGSQTITLGSINPLPDSIVIVPARFTSGMRGGRKAVFYAMTQKHLVLTLILESFTKTIDLPPLSPSKITLHDQLKHSYNPSQMEAITNALATDDLYLIQGPAGTGKTSVIVELVNQLYKNGKSILCSAYTNMAVDNIGSKLKEAGIPFLRLGNELSMSEEIKPFSALAQEQQFRTMLEKKEPIVVLSTTTTIGNDIYEPVWFDYVLLDEAAQMTEPDALRPILRGSRVILVGDHAQLQPIVTSDDAISLGLQISMFERLAQQFPERFTRLKYQYRMNSEILSFPNSKFYDGDLEPGNETVSSQQLEPFKGDMIDNSPYQVLAIANPGRNDRLQVNYAESLTIFLSVHDLIVNGNVAPSDIGIIAPFRAQVALLRSMLPYPEIEIDTVDRYQGSEREVILLSTVTSYEVPLLTDARRINVALTRAKKKLTVVATNPQMDAPRGLVDEIVKDAKTREFLSILDIKHLQSYSAQNLAKLQNEIFSRTSLALNESVFLNGFSLDEQTLVAKDHYPSPVFFLSMQLEIKTADTTVTTCPICLQVPDIGIQCPGCQYWYHENHLMAWLARKPSCPICKHTLVTET